LKKVFCVDFLLEIAYFVDRRLIGIKPAPKLYESELEIPPEEQLVARGSFLCEQRLTIAIIFFILINSL
jgi:hypothetical protein